jgi:ADP-ribosyl-[dinitrogen reductase] hydrolase
MNISFDDKNFIDRVNARLLEKEKIGDMGFMPLSDKFSEGHTAKIPWLLSYLMQRKSEKASKADLYKMLSAHGVAQPKVFERYCGALLGLATGDALGTTLEFQERDIQHVADIVGGGPFKLDAGWWTDDTSMACCLAYSLIKCRGFDARHVMESFSKWYLHGAYSPTGSCFDIGNATKSAIDHFLSSRNPYAGSEDPNSAGNGSLMRLAPVVLYYSGKFESAVHYASQSSRLTHGAQEAIDACRYFAALLYGALHGEEKDILLSELYSPVPGYWESNPLCPSIASIARGSYKMKSRDEIRSSGYVVDTLEAALWSFNRNSDFRSTLIEAVNLAGDADTVGAVCGQISGAFYGETEIPIDWITKLYGMQGFYHFSMDIATSQGK